MFNIKNNKMKTVFVVVSTLDVKITKWGDPHVKSWESLNDQEYFKHIWYGTSLIILGRNTFLFEPIKADPDRLIIIMTKEPDKYKSYEVPVQLEFRS